jgi:membrane carboxypeptidase/penicillin-binding protein PbpC
VSRYEPCDLHLLGTEAIWPVQVQTFLSHRADKGKASKKNQLLIQSPAHGSDYLYLPDVNLSQHQRIPFIATSSHSSSDLHWFVNDNYIGASPSGEPLFWPITKGSHRIVCSDSHGASRSVQISVK